MKFKLFTIVFGFLVMSTQVVKAAEERSIHADIYNKPGVRICDIRDAVKKNLDKAETKDGTQKSSAQSVN